MDVANVLYMTEGIGDSSYAKKFLFQQKVILMTKSIADETRSALNRSLSTREIICIAELVAGSFYTRLFPSKRLHFVHSSYSLHWLSKVPDGIENNKGIIYASSTSPSSYRSEELVKGGRMVLTMPGRENEHHLSNGLIEEEKVNSFNVPLYCPSPAEIKYIVEKEGSFTIDLSKTLEHQMDSSCEGYNEAQSVRAVGQPLLVGILCKDIYANIIAKEKNIFTNVIVSLIKRND
ncbi:hypothetical protein R3W88_002093 [Solanum pinnatisectum]|uniref:Uncharacterized protein n=1 Tax=Solanum pinnatisectum TaxID=50273 RepID=A0AAV9MKE5_9SOLN|nr:hypothetical protein R3W88_002093 [Solanum pinnatisectum]